MKTGFRGTFVISWAQTELDGLASAPTSSLTVGATWSWHGQLVRVDGPNDVLVLGQSADMADLRRHAARAVRRLVLAAIEAPVAKVPAPDEPLMDDGFAVTDGIRSYTATLVEVPSRDVPLLMFLDDIPPEGRDLWITHVATRMLTPHRTGDLAPQVICFTPETRISTPGGSSAVADLREDDLVLTKDDGPQPIRWIGQRRISGARLYAMPEIRPVRIRQGALGNDRPDGDLLVSPQHRILVAGRQAEVLFNAPEVLVAARDMVNDRSILVDHRLASVTYVHLLLDRHQVVFANGVETESFHPADMPLETIESEQRRLLLDRVPGADRSSDVYGAHARRPLTTAEAAILRFRGAYAH